MQKLTFIEIRHRYKEKYEEILFVNNDELKKNLEGYRINHDGKQYFIEVQNKQEECEQIIDFLNVQKKEPDVVKKYHLLLQTLPENYRQKFPDTLKYHNGYITYLINKRKNKSIQMVQSFKALKTMLSLMDKEIAAYSDEEMAELIKNKSFTTTTKQHAVWFIKYIYNKAPEQFKFNVEMSMLRRETIRGEEDFYTPEEWTAFADVFFDIDRHIEKAYESCYYARCWLYALLHMSLAWRKSDVLNIPALENLIDVSEYTLDWFENNVFSIADAQQIINHVKLEAEQYHTQKTGAKKHFNIPQAALLPTAIAFIICEQWRRKKGQAMLFEKFYADTKRMTEMFGLETDFLSLKANRTLLSMFNETAGGMAELSGKAGTLTSYMRSHKTSKMGNANITKVYLRSTYNEKESVGMGKQSILYSEDGINFTPKKPEYKEPGTYVVYYKIMRDNYATVTGSSTVTIKPKESTVNTCDCGDSYIEEIPATGHNFVDGECEHCGEKDPDYHKHNYTEEITKEATCTEAGEKTYTCDCGDSYTEKIPMTEHHYGDDDKCTECGQTNPNHIHDYEPYRVTVSPTDVTSYSGSTGGSNTTKWYLKNSTDEYDEYYCADVHYGYWYKGNLQLTCNLVLPEDYEGTFDYPYYYSAYRNSTDSTHKFCAELYINDNAVYKNIEGKATGSASSTETVSLSAGTNAFAAKFVAYNNYNKSTTYDTSKKSNATLRLYKATLYDGSEYHICNTCGEKEAHHFVDGVCIECGWHEGDHTHHYVDGVCDKCGKSETQYTLKTQTSHIDFSYAP